MELLTRENFREQCLKRDSYRCVICGKRDNDAGFIVVHHIIERKLFPNGGYYLDNGASLCEDHHFEAEMTTLSCDKIRQATGIKEIILPPKFSSAKSYDKWGNELLKNGKRKRGPLFEETGVQKILRIGKVLQNFELNNK